MKLFVLFSFFTIFTIHAQDLGIKGSVFNSKGEPIAKANIELRKMRDSSIVATTITNAKGEFELLKLNKGFYQLEISHCLVAFRKISPKVKLFWRIQTEFKSNSIFIRWWE